MNYFQTKLKDIKVALGMEVQMAEATLKDGVTRVEAEAFEPGMKLFVVSEAGEKAQAPEGVHELEDGTKVTVDAEGAISLVETVAPKEEVVVEAREEKLEEEVKEKEEESTSDDQKVEMMIDEKIDEKLRSMFEAVEEVAKEVGTLKEEMAAYKSKMEKMSKTPGSNKISTFNSEALSDKLDPIAIRLEGLKAMKEDFLSRNRKF